MMARVALAPDHRRPAITDAERRSLENWGKKYRNGALAAHRVLVWLQSGSYDEQRGILEGWTWDQMADAAGVRLPSGW